jgi:exonuclease III
MIGDFNEAMWQEEHFSKTRRSERLMLDFREVLSHCDLHDVGFMGTPWTWDNKQKGDRNVKVRLDRAVASPEWSALFPDCLVHHLTSPRSDHCPLLLTMEPFTLKKPAQPIRRYKIMWEREPSLTAMVEEA